MIKAILFIPVSLLGFGAFDYITAQYNCYGKIVWLSEIMEYGYLSCEPVFNRLSFVMAIFLVVLNLANLKEALTNSKK